MSRAKRASERRDDALSRERIIEAASELLDREGEDGLTFRALATHLATGAGAIYWHVANKEKLLLAAADAVVARALREVETATTPYEAIRKLALRVFDTVDAHPWVGVELSRAPWQSPMLQIFERVGRQIQTLGVPSAAQFTSVSALLSYIVGLSVQNASNGRRFEPSLDRASFLAREAARWQELDPHQYPFTRNIATRMREHDDHIEFLAGLDLILAGIEKSL